MTERQDLEQRARLRNIIRDANLHVDIPPDRYEPGTVLDYSMTGVCSATTGRARLEVERFVGGGFAGQVYRVRLVDVDAAGGVAGLEPGKVYALKILIPPSRFTLAFRNAVYWLGYQGPFAAQVNADAARTGVLWQKLIRRAARIRFGDSRAVADTYATVFDAAMGSYGEINEWVDGRVWKFEIDDRIFQRRRRVRTGEGPTGEYLAKKRFMAELVRLLHDMGAPEFARQYEWATCKSQPNALKRHDAGAGPAEGLTAIDFRAGLALLPFLPMSPADFGLILKGALRGRFVQFDRGDLTKLDAFCADHAGDFEDLTPVLDELKQVDPAYRTSLPDVTHHGPRLVYDRALVRKVKAGLVTGWNTRGVVDEAHAARLNASSVLFWMFYALGILPLLGGFVRRVWGNAAYRRHIASLWTRFDYFRRNLRARQAARLLVWHRTGRIGDGHVSFFLRHPVIDWLLRVFPGVLPLPVKWRRALIDPTFAWRGLKNAVLYPIRFYRDAEFRVQWLTNEIEAGAEEGMLTAEERDHILARVGDPYIQKYLKCVAVHICTLPATQIVSVIVALYCMARGQYALAGAMLALFQVIPLSPGSLLRGTYVVYLMIKERNWRNYWIAGLVSYWKYIGYLAFPLQMVTEFPALSRFMAGRWATKMVHFVPVFGERGALLEHWVFDLFFNVPLSLKRRLLGTRNKPEPDPEKDHGNG